jgi:hypothetical protein
MNTDTHSTPFPATALPRAPTTPSLELSAARQARDGLATLLRSERTAAADFLLALADFDRQRGWEPLGHASLFAFLVVELRLSKGAAFVRSSAARLLQAFPEAIEPLRDGRLCLSSVGELARVATPGNFAAVLPRFFGCSSRDAREVAAAILPREAPPTRDQVTRVAPVADRTAQAHGFAAQPCLAPTPATVPASIELEQPIDTESVRAHEPTPPRPVGVVAPGDEVEPLTADLRRLHVTVSRQFLKMLDEARDGLSHAMPGVTTEKVLEAGLALLLEKQAKARGQVKRPRASLPTSQGATVAPGAGPADAAPAHAASPFAEPPPPRRAGPREHVPAAVRRAVWERDGGRCQWPLDSGGCCGSTHRIELDHRVPWPRGGTPTVDGLRLLCRPHNLLAARLAFGARCMERYAGPRAQRPVPA